MSKSKALEPPAIQGARADQSQDSVPSNVFRQPIEGPFRFHLSVKVEDHQPRLQSAAQDRLCIIDRLDRKRL